MKKDLCENLDVEADIFSKYIVGSTASAFTKSLYRKSFSTAHITLTEQDKKLIHFMARHPRSIGIIDAGLAITHPQSEIRRRIYVIFAILEASTDYWNKFLPVKRGPGYIWVVLGSGVRAVIRALTGIIVVRLVQR